MSATRSLILVSLLASACSSANEKFCDTGDFCPAGQTCDVTTRTCLPIDLDGGAGDGAAADASLAPDAGDPVATVDAGPTAVLTIAQQDTTVFDERIDFIDFPSGPRHHHATDAAHPASQLAAGSACPAVFKHAYLLDRFSQGTESPPNPLALGFALTSSAGIDQQTIEYRVRHTASGLETEWLKGPDDLAVSGIASALTAKVTLHRSTIAELGQNDGRFDVDLRARDGAGNAEVASACFVLTRLAAPLEVLPAEAVPEATAGSLQAFRLDQDDPVSTLLNGTSPGLAVATATIRNPTSEIVYAHLAPQAVTPTVCERSRRRASLLILRTPIQLDCSSSTIGGCRLGHEIAADTANNEPCEDATVDSFVRVAGGLDCPECGADEYEIGGDGSLTVTLDLTHAAGLRPYGLASTDAAPSELTFPYFPTDTAQLANTAHLTGRREHVYQRCATMEGFGANRTCTLLGSYQIYDALMRARLTFEGPLAELERRIAPGRASSLISTVAITSPITWLTNESTGLPLQP